MTNNSWYNLIIPNLLVPAQIADTTLKILTDAGAVVVLTIVLLVFGFIINGLVRAVIQVMREYNAAIKESNEQTRLIREAMVQMDNRHVELLVGNNNIVHQTNDGIDKLGNQLRANDIAANTRHQRLLNELRIIRSYTDPNYKVKIEEIPNETEISIPIADDPGNGLYDLPSDGPGRD